MYSFLIFKRCISGDINSPPSGMSVERESTSRLPIKNSESCLTMSSAKASESFTEYSLLVKDVKTGLRDFSNL